LTDGSRLVVSGIKYGPVGPVGLFFILLFFFAFFYGTFARRVFVCFLSSLAENNNTHKRVERDSRARANRIESNRIESNPIESHRSPTVVTTVGGGRTTRR